MALAIAFFAGTTAVGLRLLWLAKLRPFAWRLLLVLFAIEALLGVLHQLKYTVGVDAPLVYQFYMHSEFAPTPLLASTQFVMTAVAALLLAWQPGPALRGERLLWSWLAIYLLFFAVDEFFSLHEAVRNWQFLYAGAVLPLALLASWVWRQAWRQQRAALALLVLGALVMALSALVVEKLVIWGQFKIGQLRMFEELFEMTGVTLLLGGLLVLAQRRLDRPQWRRLTRAVPLAGLVMVPSLAIYTWVLPAVELRLTAGPTHVEWREGDLLLRGIRVDGSPAQAGDTVSVWLYWEAREAFWEDEDLSLNAVSWPDLAHSFALVEEGDIGQYGSTGFFPGVVVRKQLTLTLPEELPTPTSLALLLRLWTGDYHEGTLRGIDVFRSRQQLAGTDQVVIGSIAVPGPPPSSPPAISMDAQFGDSLNLQGLGLPDSVAAGADLVLGLDWKVLATPARRLTQFLHLFSLAEGDFAAGFDEAPFSGRFPATDWPVGAVLRDQWSLRLPSTLAPGDYRLVYGVYEARTHERLTLKVDGEAMADGLLPLGTLRVQPGET